MGKQKRPRQKYHISAKKESLQKKDDSFISMEIPQTQMLTLPSGNLFAGINIDVNSLNKNLSDDTVSVKSYKSAKAKLGHKIVPKKDKLKLRRELLLKKIDTVNQLKKERKIRKKRKNVDLIGDTNPLHDALPSLESLLKNRPSIPYKDSNKIVKTKGIEKATKRKKQLVQGVSTYKQLLNNKHFQKNPLESISQHVKAVVNQQQKKITL